MIYRSRTIICFCALAAGVAAVFVTHASPNKGLVRIVGTRAEMEEPIDTKNLTVEETIGLALHGEGAQWHLYSRANIAARPDLYQLLDDMSSGLYTFHENIFHILAYSGNENDICYMLSVLDGYSGPARTLGAMGSLRIVCVNAISSLC